MRLKADALFGGDCYIGELLRVAEILEHTGNRTLVVGPVEAQLLHLEDVREAM